jgi:hypothetical protein
MTVTELRHAVEDIYSLWSCGLKCEEEKILHALLKEISHRPD